MILLVQGPIPHIAFHLENAGVDCERTVRLARAVCVIGTSQINRRWIEESVLRLVRRRRGAWVGKKRAVDPKREHHDANDYLNHDSCEAGCGLSTNQVQNR